MSAKGRPWWGFHELIDPWAHRLVNAASIRPGELVLDIGAGRGAITAHLVTAGARVVAVELHPERARQLRRRFGSHIIVVQADATDLRLPRGEFKVVANPPFGITTSLLRRLVSSRSRLLSADIVVPSPTAARWTGGRGQRSATYTATTVARLPPTAFRPPTPIATAVLRLERHGHGGADPNAPSAPSTILMTSRCPNRGALTVVTKALAQQGGDPEPGPSEVPGYLSAEGRYQSVPYRRCGRRGLFLPAVSLGLWQNFGDDRPIHTQRSILRRAFRGGVSGSPGRKRRRLWQ